MRSLPLISLASLMAIAAPAALAQDASGEGTTGIDWGVALRGSYEANSLTGGRASLVLAPDVAVTVGGERTVSRLASGLALVVDDAGQARVSGLNGRAESLYRLDAVTTLNGSIEASLEQGRPDASDLPANTLAAPIIAQGRAQGVAQRDFNRIDLRATLDGARYMKGPTRLDDLSSIDNGADSFWSGGATLRASYELTPLLSAFLEGEASVKLFDAPSPSLAVKLDGRTYQLRGGLAYVHGSIVSAEASVGRAWLDYFDPTLSDAPGWVYNAALAFNPDETLSLGAGFETVLGPSSKVPGDTALSYSATATARYLVNPWLTLRSSAGWEQATTLGTGSTSWGYEAGLGLDYRSSRHIVWSADYRYQRESAPPVASNDTHSFTIGARVQR